MTAGASSPPPRLTKPRFVGLALGGWALVGAVVANDRPRPVWLVDGGQQVTWEERPGPGEPWQAMGVSPGGALALRAVLAEARPSRNPLRIAWETLWYNAMTSGYDLRLWVEPRDRKRYRPFLGWYQDGHVVYLRDSEGLDLVLVSPLAPDEVRARLAPFAAPRERD